MLSIQPYERRNVSYSSRDISFPACRSFEALMLDVIQRQPQNQSAQDKMSKFSTLPLELRSEILRDWLEYTVKDHCGIQAVLLGWTKDDEADDYVSTQLLEDNHRRVEAKRQAAATKVRKLISAFSPEDQPELERLLTLEAATLREEGRRLCAYLLEARRVKPLAWWLERYGRLENWMTRVKDVHVLEWSCNTVEMAIHIDRENWTRLEVHAIACGRDGKACQCLASLRRRGD